MKYLSAVLAQWLGSCFCENGFRWNVDCFQQIIESQNECTDTAFGSKLVVNYFERLFLTFIWAQAYGILSLKIVSDTCVCVKISMYYPERSFWTGIWIRECSILSWKIVFSMHLTHACCWLKSLCFRPYAALIAEKTVIKLNTRSDVSLSGTCQAWESSASAQKRVFHLQFKRLQNRAFMVHYWRDFRGYWTVSCLSILMR